MYLVELRPGKEELYRTGDDLALAIRDGDVDSRSRIYHRATAKWISITLHPQYRAIVTGRQEELARRARRPWGLLPDLAAPLEDSAPVEAAASGDGLLRWKRPLGLGLSSILLLLGVQLAFSGPRPPWAGRGTEAVVWSEGNERIDSGDRTTKTESEGLELVSLASMTSPWPAKPEPSDTVAVPAPAAAPVLPRAPTLRSKALRASLVPNPEAARVKANSVEGILSRYGTASDAVLARLETGMRVARLDRLFSTSRLSPGGGVTDTRMSLAGLVNFIRVFRRQQAAVDKVYQDSVHLLAKRHRWAPKDVKQWYSRPPRAEAPALELLSSTLIAEIDSLLGVLDAQAGAYKLRGTAIAFEDPMAGEAYGALRRRIQDKIEAAMAAGGSTSAGPTNLLLQAIGTSSLPRET